ncbi:MAG: VPA1262 family N-terminal domain-containing protein [Gammaproteobacteria bacterium]
MELWLLEKRPSGLMAPRKFRFKNNQVIVKHDHLLATEALAMVCPQRGILGWHEPLSFLRSIHINQSVTKRTELIEVPKRGQKVAAYRYQSQQVSTPNEYIVPTSASRARTEQEQLRILAAMRGIRRQTEKARKPTAPTEYWFDQDSRDQAVQVIRGLIQRARERVWLIDPYITDRVLYEFGLAVQQEDADLRVLTSKKDRDSDQGPSQKHQSLHELHRRVIYFDAQGYSFLVRLLSDKALHDRFLVIDQQVWMAGSSFDSIGDSAGMFVQLREPEPIIERLAALFESGKPLETWIKDHGGSNGD